MSDDVPQGEQPPKITEENEEVIEKEEGSQASDQPPRSTPEKSSASAAATSSDPSTKSTPEKSGASDEASKSTPEKPTTAPDAKAVSEEGPATVPPAVSVQPPAAEPPVSSPPKVGRTPEKKPGIFKGLIKEAYKTLFKRDSPKKQDSIAFVPEASGGAEASASSSAAATSAKPAPAAKKSKRERKGSLYVDSPMSESRTLITELEGSSSSGTDFPASEADRKASIASSDTGAHISMLPNLEDAGSSKEAEDEKEEVMEVDKGDASPDQPMEDEQ